jgi:hypothetical protein
MSSTTFSMHAGDKGAPAGPITATLLARGEYLTRAADCSACHSAPNGKPFAGGVAFKLPFGTIYSSFNGFGDARVQCAPRLAQQGAVSGVLYEGVLKQIACVGRHAMPEQQSSRNEAIQRG